ncbi:GEgh 16 [Favolaschia claudopus]|uniref:GEgh 16 n=1 Tax=Favolaschia claudopus TaxID=2862362 RepID=A0AAW0DR95_9AGAR
MFFKTLVVLAALSSSTFFSVHAHGTVTSVAGANGVKAAGFGIIASTPRDGTKRNPFQQDTSIIKDRDIASGKTGACGRTLAGGNNDVATQLAAASQAGLPTAGADGSVTMTLHQINGDGAGPYTCDVSGDGGNTFQPAQVTQQVPGTRGRSRAKATDFALVAQMPAGMACTAGPGGDACIMRCRNPVGPFGSCVAVAQGEGAAAAGNATATPIDGAADSDADTEAPEDAAGAGAVTTGAAGTGAATTGAAGTGAAVGAATGTTATKATKAGGNRLGDFLSGLGIGGAGKAAREASVPMKKRYIDSRVAGRRAGYWLDSQ